MILDRDYQYIGSNPILKGKVGNIIEAVDENIVIFKIYDIAYEQNEEIPPVLDGLYRVQFKNLRLV